jgi:hypothetical protein
MILGTNMLLADTDADALRDCRGPRLHDQSRPTTRNDGRLKSSGNDNTSPFGAGHGRRPQRLSGASQVPRRAAPSPRRRYGLGRLGDRGVCPPDGCVTDP